MRDGFDYLFRVTVVYGPCTEHLGCMEYSVIPRDSAKASYRLHSAAPNPSDVEVSLEHVQRLLAGLQETEE